MHREKCSARCREMQETMLRRVRTLPLFEYRVVLRVTRRRVSVRTVQWSEIRDYSLRLTFMMRFRF